MTRMLGKTSSGRACGRLTGIVLAPLTMAAITIATPASASAASPPRAGDVAQGSQEWLIDVVAPGDPDPPRDPGAGGRPQGPIPGNDAANGPGLWRGGSPAGGTGIDTGPDIGSGPAIWRGGSPAGGTGMDPGPDTGSGPDYWNGGNPAGAY
jgi:hypothetical protein